MAVSLATQTTMGETAEPAKKRKRAAEDEQSEESALPRVKEEDENKPDAGERPNVKRTVELRANKDNKRKAAVAAPTQDDIVARAASLTNESKPRTRGGAVLPRRDAEAASDSSSYSDIASGASVPRGSIYGSESGGDSSPKHVWSDDGRETLSEARAREKRGRINYRSNRARSRSRGHATGSHDSRARPARSGTPPEYKIVKRWNIQRNAVFF